MTEPRVYRKKPVLIGAIQYDGSAESIAAIEEWTGKVCRYNAKHGMLCKTLEGRMKVNPGSYVIRGVAGEFYPCKEDIFNETYEIA